MIYTTKKAREGIGVVYDVSVTGQLLSLDLNYRDDVFRQRRINGCALSS